MDRAITLYERLEDPIFKEYFELLEMYLQQSKLSEIQKIHDLEFVIDGKVVKCPEYMSIDDLLQRHYDKINKYYAKMLAGHKDYSEKIETIFDTIHGYEIYKSLITLEKYSPEIAKYKRKLEKIQNKLQNAKGNNQLIVQQIINMHGLFKPDTKGSGLLYVHRLPEIGTHQPRHKTKQKGGQFRDVRLKALSAIIERLPIAHLIQIDTEKAAITKSRLLETISKDTELASTLPANYKTYGTRDLLKIVFENSKKIDN